MPDEVRDTIQVSPEMLALLGAGRLDPADFPEEPVAFAFLISESGPSTLQYLGPVDRMRVEEEEANLVLIVARAACLRLFPDVDPGEGLFQMPPELRAIAVNILNGGRAGPARMTLRLAKSIELLCETFAAFAAGAFIPAARPVQMSYQDCQRIHAARCLIENRWSEKLTLNSIAADCGLNRSKLARGFRDMYDRSVADLIAEQRLGEARQMLLETELPIGSIGYRCGYLNNAAFTRAFARRFGIAPSGFRASAMAA